MKTSGLKLHLGNEKRNSFLVFQLIMNNDRNIIFETVRIQKGAALDLKCFFYFFIKNISNCILTLMY